MKRFLESHAADKRCVACGKAIEFSKHGLPNHRCDERFEAAVEAANRRSKFDRFPTPTWGQRLDFGFSLLRNEIGG